MENGCDETRDGPTMMRRASRILMIVEMIEEKEEEDVSDTNSTITESSWMVASVAASMEQQFVIDRNVNRFASDLLNQRPLRLVSGPH